MPRKMLTRNFAAEEFTCKHCGAAGIRSTFVEQLQRFRDYIGKPIKINSGYRCKQHPVEAAKLSPGRHTEGIAADISGPPILEIWRALEHFPEFTGVGVSLDGNYVHVDTRRLPAGVRRALWAYDDAGKPRPWDSTMDVLMKGGTNV